MPPPRVYITVSRSGQIRRPCKVTSSPVLTSAVISASGTAARTPRRNRAPPMPPATTTSRTPSSSHSLGQPPRPTHTHSPTHPPRRHPNEGLRSRIPPPGRPGVRDLPVFPPATGVPAGTVLPATGVPAGTVLPATGVPAGTGAPVGLGAPVSRGVPPGLGGLVSRGVPPGLGVRPSRSVPRGPRLLRWPGVLRPGSPARARGLGGARDRVRGASLPGGRRPRFL